MKKKVNKKDSRKHGKPARGFARGTASRPDARKEPRVHRGQHSSGKPAGTREGTFSHNARGFGFVVTDGEEQDVFVPPDSLGGAMHGDRVRVRVETSPKGLSGRVVEVLGRAIQYVSGQIHVTRDGAWLDPDDERMRMAIKVQGDLPEGARTGQGALAKIVRYPEHGRDTMAVEVLEVFEPEAFVEHEIRRIVLKEGVQEEFPLDVRDEAALIPQDVDPADYEGREDLRNIALMTIDPVDARDHDDAVWAERLPHGGFRLIVAIADVSHYVREARARDRERSSAAAPSTCRRAPFELPQELSSNLASLCPTSMAHRSPSKPCSTPRQRAEPRFIEGVMRSVADVPYEAVAQALGLLPDGPVHPLAHKYLPELKVLLEVSGVLREIRRRRGSLELELPEPKVRVDDETGRPTDVERSRKDPGVARAYNLIEELMLLANEIVARDLAERNVPTIFRTHGHPDPDRIETLRAAQSLATARRRVRDKPKEGRVPAPHPRHAASRHARLPDAARDEQAVYSVQTKATSACRRALLHFTSPIRRYRISRSSVIRSVARGVAPAAAGSERLAAQASKRACASGARGRSSARSSISTALS